MTNPAYSVSAFQHLDDMKTYHPGGSVLVAATIMGNAYPVDESYKVYVWDNNSTAAIDEPEVVKPIADPTDNGRWLRVDVSTIPQVNADWNSTTGLSKILNKPTLASVATSGLYADLLSKPTLATVATSGSYNDLINKPTIPSPVILVGSPTARTVALSTAYQANDNTKPALVTINLTSTASLSLSGGTTVTGEVRIGSANTVASGASGTPVGNYKNSLTGTLAVGLNIQTDSNATITFLLPAGWYFAARLTGGTGLSVVSAYEQTISI